MHWKAIVPSGGVCGISISGVAYGNCGGMAFIWPDLPNCPPGYTFGNWMVLNADTDPTTYSSCFKN